MKELVDYAYLEELNSGELKIIIVKNEFDLCEIWSGSRQLITDVMIERSSDNLKISGRKIYQTAGFELHRKLVKNLSHRPLPEYIQKDIFGREYVRGNYKCAPEISKEVTVWETNNFTIIW